MCLCIQKYASIRVFLCRTATISMLIYMHMNICIYIYVCIWVYAWLQLYLDWHPYCLSTFMTIFGFIPVSASSYGCIFLCSYVYRYLHGIFTSRFMSAFMFLPMHLYAYVYSYTHMVISFFHKYAFLSACPALGCMLMSVYACSYIEKMYLHLLIPMFCLYLFLYLHPYLYPCLYLYIRKPL